MVEFSDVSMRFATQELYSGVNLRITAGERIGIVGPNGAGKSTLFQLILGQMQPDSGTVTVDDGIAIGFVRQHPEPSTDEETLLEYSVRGVPRIHEMEARLREAEAAVDAATDDASRARLLKELGRCQTEFEHVGGYDLETRVKEALGGLGFKASTFNNPFRSFSGGWRMRAELARVLASKPDLLMLDEPSNYLDIPAVEWLQRFLHSYDGTLLIISHDRYLLRSLTTLTIEVDAGQVTRYQGDFDYYMREREVRYQSLLQAKANQDRHREQLERFIDRFKAQANKASQAQSRMKIIEKMEEIKLPKRSRSSGKMRLAAAPHCGEEVIRFENATFAYSPELPPVISDLTLRVNRGDKIGIVGFNGMGKTTLLRLMAGTRQLSSGVRMPGHKVEIGYQSQDFGETIPSEVTVISCAKRAAPYMMERDLRTQLGGFGFTTEDIDKPAGVLSGGERIRLAFFLLFVEKPNFLLLDEPTTHLDLEGRTSLEKALKEYDGTICLVSHDIEFVRAIATSIIYISEEGVRTYPGTYDEFRDFMARRAASGAKAPEPAKEEAAPSATKPGLTSKELRKLRADIRAKYQPRMAPLKKRVDAAERKIAELEAKEKELTEAMSAENADHSALCSELRNVQMKLHMTALDWENDATALEELQNQMDAEMPAE